MLSLFIVVGCVAKALNKRLERRLAEYADVRNSAEVSNLFPITSAKNKLGTLDTRSKEISVG